MVPTRLWLGGAISHKRDLHLIQALTDQIRQIALCRELLLAVDGLSSYLKAYRRSFRTPYLEKGKKGRPRLISWPKIAIVQVVKQRKGKVLTIDRRIALRRPGAAGRSLLIGTSETGTAGQETLG